MGTARALAVAVLLLCGYQAALSLIQIDPSTRQFVDEQGRVRIYHGVNAVYKIPPWQPITTHFDPQNSISAEDIQNLTEWGFNVVRLGVMWPGVMPSEHKSNTTYLDNMKNLVDSLGAAGIYTIVDFHQDVLSRTLCGEGAPDWAMSYGRPVKPFPEPIAAPYATDSHGYPALETCLNKSFALYYTTNAAGAAFQGLYDNVNGMQDHFAEYWTTLAKLFADNEYVLGYELINEPWLGDVFHNPKYALPEVADRENLAPMYARLNSDIRKIDDQHIIFYERSVGDIVFPCGLTEGPGGDKYNNRQAYSYHVYCAPVDGDGDPTNRALCHVEDDGFYHLLLEDAKKMNVGSLMTEFGAMEGDEKALHNLIYLTKLAERHFQGWIYWQFKYFQDLTTQGSGESFYDANGRLYEDKVKTLSRTYARAIAGTPVHTAFTETSGHFELDYEVNTSILAPTEIYLNEAWYYPDGYSAYLVIPVDGVTIQRQHNLILVNADPTTTINGTLVRVRVRATETTS